MKKRFERKLYLGTDIKTGRSVSLRDEWFETHLHIIGPPGRGKTRFLLWILKHLLRNPKATTVLINPKGNFARMARDLMISEGQSKRMIWMDAGDPDAALGYNPLRPSARPVATHAKAVREATRSAWGQTSFDETPQLARLLLLSLAVSISLGGTLLDAVRLLRSGPAGKRVRRDLFAMLASGKARGERDLLVFLKDALAWFDSLDDRRQEELGASTLARLEAFVCDPVVSRMLTQKNCLDMSRVIAEHKALLVNLELNRPLGIDDIRLLGRLIVNDVLNVVSSRGPSADEPVYLILDEAHTFVTHDLCSILDMGRELGLHCILAHQNLGQLRREDRSDYVYDSVRGSALTKFYFGGLAKEDLDVLAPDACIEQYDPHKTKDVIWTPFLRPVESRRTVVTESRNVGISRGSAQGKSQSRSRVDARGFSRTKGTSTTDGESSASASASGFAIGSNTGHGAGETLLPNGDLVETSSEMDGMSESYVDNQSNSYSETHTRGIQRSKSVQYSRARGRAEASQEVRNLSITKGVSRSATETPFYEYDEIERVSSRTYQSEQEFVTGYIQDMKRQPVGHVFVKVPGQPGRFLRLPWVSTPWISGKTRKAAMARVYSLPCYSRPEEPEESRLPENAALPLIGGGQQALIPERSEVIGRDDDATFTSPIAPFKPQKRGKK